MSKKSLITLGLIVGSTVGGYLPVFFGAGIFSYISIITSGIGAVLGVWIGYKLGE